MDERTTNLLGALVMALADALRDATEEAAGHGGTGPAALAVAAQWPGETVGSLGQRLGLTQPAGVRLVDRLAMEGLVERERGRDGREVVVAITEPGAERAERVLAARRRVLAEALVPLSPDEQAQFSSLLEQILARITTDVSQACRICRLCEIRTCPHEQCPVSRGARTPPAPATSGATPDRKGG
jgi:DNA-binding MarR family transcriptional regulator